MFPATSQPDVFIPVHRLTWLTPEGGVDWEDVPSYISVRRLHRGSEPVHRLPWLNPEGGVDWEDVPGYISVRRLHPGTQTDVVKPRGRGGLGGCSQLHLSQTSSSRSTD